MKSSVNRSIEKDSKLARGSGQNKSPVLSLRNALDVLQSFSAAEPAVGVNELARRLGLHKSTISRILATLEEDRLVEKEAVTGRFRLGIGLVTLANTLLANMDIAQVARPYLEKFANEAGETITLSLWSRGAAVNLEQYVGPGAIKHFSPPGRINPAHATATGKAFMAYLNPAELEAVLSEPLEKFTPNTIVDPEKLRDEIALIRKRGYAVHDEEWINDLVVVAAVVRNNRSEVVASVAASVPKFRFVAPHSDKIVEQLLTAVENISRSLGYLGN